MQLLVGNQVSPPSTMDPDHTISQKSPLQDGPPHRSPAGKLDFEEEITPARSTEPSSDGGLMSKLGSAQARLRSAFRHPPPGPQDRDAEQQHPQKAFSIWASFRKFVSFLGPGAIVSVAYIDPDNYQTAISSGASFQYKLLFMVLISNLIAIYLQVQPLDPYCSFPRPYPGFI